MSIKPLFNTAPRIKMKIGDTTIAFAIGLNISVNIDITPIQIIGQFGPASLEPTFYNPVTGTIQIQKLLSNYGRQNVLNAAKNYVGDKTNNDKTLEEITRLKTVADYGTEGLPEDLKQNKDGEIVDADGVAQTIGTGTYKFVEYTTDNDKDNNSILSHSALYQHFTPAEVLASTTFNLDLYLNQSTSTSDAGYVSWMRIKDVRLTSRNTNITLGQIVNEPVSFQGLLLTPMTKTPAEQFNYDSGPKTT